MILKYIEIENFRSIDYLRFEIKEINNSYTYSLIGINESGKSSILNAINLVDNERVTYPQDFHDAKKPVIIKLGYGITPEIVQNFKDAMEDALSIPKEILAEISFDNIIIKRIFNPDERDGIIAEEIDFKKRKFRGYSFDHGNSINVSADLKSEVDIAKITEIALNNHFWSNHSHKIVFWASSDKYMLLENIDLHAFSNSPDSTSVPLNNCFKLIGMTHEDITNITKTLNNPVSINNLQSQLSDKVTEHINKIWPDHRFRLSSKSII